MNVKNISRLLLIPMFCLSFCGSQLNAMGDSLGEIEQPSLSVDEGERSEIVLPVLPIVPDVIEVKTLSEDLLAQGMVYFNQELAANKIKRRVVKGLLITGATAAAAYMCGRLFEADPISFPAWLQVGEGQKVPMFVQLAEGQSLPKNMVMYIAKGANDNAEKLDEIQLGMLKKIKNFGGSVWGWTKWGVAALSSFAAIELLKEGLKKGADFSLLKCGGIFNSRDMSWCLGHTKAFLIGHKLKLHAAALDSNSTALKSPDYLSIAIYPGINESYQTNEGEVAGDALKELVAIKRYVEIRKSFLESDTEEQGKEFELLQHNWNLFVEAMAYTCACFQKDIDVVKLSDVKIAVQLTNFKKIMIREVETASQVIQDCLDSGSYDRLYSTIQNCVVQCKNIMDLSMNELEKALD